MSWEDVDEILLDGTKEQILDVKCPDCCGDLEFDYSSNTREMETFCARCGTLIRSHGMSHEPNFYKFKIHKTKERVSVRI